MCLIVRDMRSPTSSKRRSLLPSREPSGLANGINGARICPMHENHPLHQLLSVLTSPAFKSRGRSTICFSTSPTISSPTYTPVLLVSSNLCYHGADTGGCMPWYIGRIKTASQTYSIPSGMASNIWRLPVSEDLHVESSNSVANHAPWSFEDIETLPIGLPITLVIRPQVHVVRRYDIRYWGHRSLHQIVFNRSKNPLTRIVLLQAHCSESAVHHVSRHEQGSRVEPKRGDATTLYQRSGLRNSRQTDQSWQMYERHQ